LQTYFIRSVKNYILTVKTITLSFDVTNLQTISKLENSNHTYEYVSKYVQIYRLYIKWHKSTFWDNALPKNNTLVYFTKPKILEPNAVKNH